MRIPCPFCGDRDVSEFSVRGEVPATPRPDADAPGSADAMARHLFTRVNPAGPNREHWHHAAGCRAWLVVERDTRTHAVLAVGFA